jgi:hypothetical protein
VPIFRCDEESSFCIVEFREKLVTKQGQCQKVHTSGFSELMAAQIFVGYTDSRTSLREYNL